MGRALVTGASRGIGAALARRAAADGHDLILAARSESDLREVADEIRAAHGVEIRCVAVDLGRETEADRLWDSAIRDGPVEILLNNAGLGANDPFAETRGATRERALVAVNVGAATILMKHAAAHMAARGTGQILNVASVCSFLPGPGMAVYHASKAYLLSLSEAASEELRGTGVTVTALCPGPTRSNFFAAAGMAEGAVLDRVPVQTCEEVARIGWRAMRRGRRVVVPGTGNRLAALAARLTPHALVLPMTHKLMGKRRT